MEKVGQLAWAGRWGLPGRRMSYTKGAACPRRRGQCSGGGAGLGGRGPGQPLAGRRGPPAPFRAGWCPEPGHTALCLQGQDPPARTLCSAFALLRTPSPSPCPVGPQPPTPPTGFCQAAGPQRGSSPSSQKAALWSRAGCGNSRDALSSPHFLFPVTCGIHVGTVGLMRPSSQASDGIKSSSYTPVLVT